MRQYINCNDAKIPVDDCGSHINHLDPTNWLTLQQAQSTGLNVSYVLNGNGVWCLDIDGCIDNAGNLNDIAQELVKRARGKPVYVETSISKTGLHIWGRYEGAIPQHACKNTVLKIELYTNERHIILGEPLRIFGLSSFEQVLTAPASNELFNDLVAGYFSPCAPGSEQWNDLSLWVAQDNGLALDTIRRRKAANCANPFNGALSLNELCSLSLEEWEQQDKSSTDMALLNHLAFHTGRNHAAMERLYRASNVGMYRGAEQPCKLDRSAGRDCNGLPVTYLQRSILRAAAECSDVWKSPTELKEAKLAERAIALQRAADCGQLTNCESLNGRNLADSFGHVWKICELSGQVYQFNGVHYEPFDLMRGLIPIFDDHLGCDYKQSLVRNSIDNLMPRLQQVRFNADPDKIAFSNGVLHIKAGEFGAHTCDDYFTHTLAVDYDSNGGDWSYIRSVLDNLSAGDPATLCLLIAYLALILRNHPMRELQKYLEITGSAGGGKGSYCSIVKALTGDYCGSFSIAGLSDSHALESIPGKRVLICSEHDGQILRKEQAIFKKLTGGDEIKINPKNKSQYDIVNDALMIVTSNDSLRFPTNQRDIERRRLPVHVGAVNYQLNPRHLEDIKAGLPGLVHNLLKHDVNQAVQIVNEDQQRRPQAYVAVQVRSNTVTEWAAEYIQVAPGSSLPLSNAYLAYSNWCRDSGLKVMGRGSFSTGLQTSLNVLGVPFDYRRREHGYHFIDISMYF
ncbi:MAG: DUF5906 domain-containing protein [Pseudomonadota bacterium]|nr:DUF5906 domain-containing protein [Pseudomonadota bacterium]